MRLAELLDMAVLQTLADANFRASAMPISIIDAVDGSILVRSGWQEICAAYHRANPISAERCRQSDDQVRLHAADSRPFEYGCRNGLRHVGIAIRVAGEHLATLFLGQFFYEGEPPERARFVEQARQLGFDEAGYLAALDRVPLFSRAAIENILAYDGALAQFISGLAEASLRRTRAEAHAATLARFPEENPDPVLRVDAELRIVYSNASAIAKLRALGVALGQPAPPRLAELARRAWSEQRRVQDEVSSGDCIFSMTFVAVGDEVNVYAHDITARVRAEAALDRERSLLAGMMQATDVQLGYLDRDFDFVWVNPAYAAGCRMQAEELVGENYFALFPSAEDEAIFRRVRDTGQSVFHKDKPFEHPGQPERGVTYWDWSLVPVKDAAGAVAGLVVSLRETTRFKRAEVALRDSEALARTGLDAARLGTWRHDLLRGEIRFDERAAQHYGFASGVATVDEVVARTHPDDAGHLLAAMEETLDPARSRGRFGLEYRVVHPDGAVRWLSVHARVEVAGEGGAPRAAVWIGTSEDITSRKQAEEQLASAAEALRRANEQLRDADRRKDEFLGMLSHELRNPLAPIRNAVYILRHAEPGGEQARRAQSVIERQAEHLARLVDDLLDVTRIARGKISLRRERADLRDVVRRTAEDFRTLMEDRAIVFRTAVTDARLWAEVDSTRVAQLVGNLLQNAAKFTPRGGAVTLSLQAAGEVAELRVRDSGSGIEPALLPHVFDAFVQGERTLARSQGGLGLGLALVAGIAELHGGTVRAESAGPGAGSEFIVALPLVPAAPVERRPPVATSGGVTGRRVLVVDDNQDAAESLAQIVEMFGHVAEIAFDGPTAIQKARATRPDVVFCDLGLPEMSGYEVARALRAVLAGAQLIALSGYAQPEEVKAAVDAGFDCHIAKPADLAAIERLLA